MHTLCSAVVFQFDPLIDSSVFSLCIFESSSNHSCVGLCRQIIRTIPYSIRLCFAVGHIHNNSFMSYQSSFLFSSLLVFIFSFIFFIFARVKLGTHMQTKQFVNGWQNQMYIGVDRTADMCCAICEWFIYHSLRTIICQFLYKHKTHFLCRVIHGSLWSYGRFHISHTVSCPPCPEKIVQNNYLYARTYHTGASFELIFKKFACLMRANPTVFGDNRPNRTTNMGENVTPKILFWLSFSRYGIFLEKTYKQYLVPHSPQKRFNLFLSCDAYLASKMVMYPQNNFSLLF